MRSYYAILGVTRKESPEGIRAAYHHRAREVHPDRTGGDSGEDFRQLREAYDVLSDPAARRRYDSELERRGRPRRSGGAPEPRQASPEPLLRTRRRAEPLIPEPASLFRDFQTVRPSRDALRDRIIRGFTGEGVPKAERVEALTVEIQLTPDQAARGAIVPLAVPVFSTCATCRGRGSTWLAPCPTCAQQGIVEGEAAIRIELPPGTRSGTVRELPLDGLGIDNLYLRLVVQVV